MTDDPSILASFGGVARLFPLPNLVLFPHIVQGLHIFEPRYRQMTADALDGDKLLAMVLLKPGWEPHYEGRPPVESIACLSRITDSDALPDGRYNLRLRGIARVRLLDELPANKLYRTTQAEVVVESDCDDIQQLARLRRTLADAVLARFDPNGPAHRHITEMFAGDTPLGPLCDMLAYALPLSVPLKQQLLEEPGADARAEILTHAMQTAAITNHRPFPPTFSEN